jgi:ketopantoate reductase
VRRIEAGLTQKGGKAVASILGDIEKGGAVEGKQIVGDMLARAARHGIAAPNLRFAYAHLQTYEARRARNGGAEVKILILGAGAIGGYVGGRCSRAAPTSLSSCGRRAASAAARRAGHQEHQGRHHPEGEDGLSGSEGGPYDVVLLTCKAYDLRLGDRGHRARRSAPTLRSCRCLNACATSIRSRPSSVTRKWSAAWRASVSRCRRGRDPAHQPVRRISFGERDGKPARRYMSSSMQRSRRAASTAALHKNIVQDLWDKWIMLLLAGRDGRA